MVQDGMHPLALRPNELAALVAELHPRALRQFFKELERNCIAKGVSLEAKNWWFVVAHNCHAAADALDHLLPRKRKKKRKNK